MHMKNMTTKHIAAEFLTSAVPGTDPFAHKPEELKAANSIVCTAASKSPATGRPDASWSDAQLITAVRCEPPNEAALDVLVQRYWGKVFGRCLLLTVNHEKALDLAQATWCRLLRNRQAIKPEGNFPAYVTTIARNLFRDSYRAAQRAGALAEHRLVSLDESHFDEDGDSAVLADMVSGLKSLESYQQSLLAIDIDRALQQLSPLLRAVLVARFIDGESCAEIAVRYGRTEQSISGWVREALRQMKYQLEEPAMTIKG
jgi:RNA polymerase sigma factor (sigma-70 family)